MYSKVIIFLSRYRYQTSYQYVMPKRAGQTTIVVHTFLHQLVKINEFF